MAKAVSIVFIAILAVIAGIGTFRTYVYGVVASYNVNPIYGWLSIAFPFLLIIAVCLTIALDKNESK